MDLEKKKSLTEQLDIKVNYDKLINNGCIDFKDKESVGTISMIDGLTMTKVPGAEERYSNNGNLKHGASISIKDDKFENESAVSSKHSVKSTNFRERFSKFHNNKSLKIKKTDDFMKPQPIKSDGHNFLSNLSVHSKDTKSVPNMTPSSNFVSTPNIFKSGFRSGDKKETYLPMVFSRGQTPEIMNSNNNIFSFENAKSPGMFKIGSPFKMYTHGGDQMLDIAPSPFTQDYNLKNQSYSPAFNYNDSSSRRPANQNYFFNSNVVVQENTGKTSEQNVFFQFGNQPSSHNKPPYYP